MTHSPRKDLKPLTGLRFFAALHVLLFHAYGTWADATLFDLPYPLTNLFRSGYVGVSLFFVLSGFILAYTYLEKDLSRSGARRSFWLARFARIYPIYLLGLLLATPKFLYTLLPIETGPEAATAALTAVSVASLTQAWSPTTALGWLPPGWSLSAEAFFYLLFPVVALGVRRWSLHRVTGAIALCWLATLVAPTLYYTCAPGSTLWAGVVKFNPLIRLPEFLFGVGLGRIFLLRSTQTRTAPVSSRLLQYPLLVAGLIIVALVFQDVVPKFYMHNGLIIPLFAWLILSLAASTERTRGLSRFLSNPTLLLLGQASYALYILHIPIKGLMVFAAERMIDISILRTGSGFFLAYLATTIVASILAFRFVETPARIWIKRRFGRPEETNNRAGHTPTAPCVPSPANQPALPSSS